LSGLSPVHLEDLVRQHGERAYRGRQLFEHIHAHGAARLDPIALLPSALRSRLLQTGWTICSLTVATHLTSRDGTVKLGLETHDGHLVESVLIPMDNGTFTQCLSSQVGCALDCLFCKTGSLGLRRNLTPAEIVDQHLLARRSCPAAEIRNLVFMGMGEPLHNFDNVRAAILLLQEPRGRNISPRRITLSTAGVVPGIERLLHEVPALLAVSLNAPTQELRARLMPVARRYPLPRLMAALHTYSRHMPRRQRITIEYVLLGGVNDRPEDARALVRLLASIRYKLNLIRFNPYPDSSLSRPTDQAVDRFLEILTSKQVTVTVRKSKGLDIMAACGQLAGERREFKGDGGEPSG